MDHQVHPREGIGVMGNQQQSPLLRLPGELRNKIYQYALTEDEGFYRRLLGWMGGSRFQLQVKDGKELNQLKYTCRQLRSKASGLGLQWNTITFSARQYRKGTSIYGMQGSASVNCVGFMDVCSSRQKGRLKARVTEESEYKINEKPSHSHEKPQSFYWSALPRIVDLCNRHPGTEVTLYLLCLRRFELEKQISVGWTVQMGFRKTMTTVFGPAGIQAKYADKIGSRSREWPCFALDAPPFPANLKVRIEEDMLGPEGYLEISYHEHDRLDRLGRRRPLEGMLDQLRSWVQDGI